MCLKNKYFLHEERLFVKKSIKAFLSPPLPLEDIFESQILFTV